MEAGIGMSPLMEGAAVTWQRSPGPLWWGVCMSLTDIGFSALAYDWTLKSCAQL